MNTDREIRVYPC